MKIEYKDADGRLLKLEVSDEVGQFYLSSVEETKKSDRRNTRPDRHTSLETFVYEYYPPWEPPVSRLRATRKQYFPPSEPPLHIVAAHIFDFNINLLIVVIGELQMQYRQIIYKEVFLCLRRQKPGAFWSFWEKT